MGGGKKKTRQGDLVDDRQIAVAKNSIFDSLIAEAWRCGRSSAARAGE
jgi:hypothetical protein